ncbi:hypothetical protein [Microbacterium foliorum]|uniref:hypothetical protein n=1 Tax=Microbacterium foliorum TaxID=104336 RepID=UPI0012E09869|nr:hypothetical protein [Microbacterium foliorum]
MAAIMSGIVAAAISATNAAARQAPWRAAAVRGARPTPVARPTASLAGNGARLTAVESADDASNEAGETRVGEFIALDM